DSVATIFEEVNRDTAGPARLHLELTRWETDSYPGFHPEGPQGLIDPLLDIGGCDLVIAIFWSKMGTPTPSGQTGTEREFTTALESFKRHQRPQIMVYFCDRPVPPDANVEQLARVKRFRASVEDAKGLYWPYTTVQDFERTVAANLRNYLRQQIKTIWAKEAVELRHMDEERASRPPIAAILGRLSERDHHDRPVSQMSTSWLHAIGGDLARAGWRLMVYDSGDEYAATDLVKGYV